MINKLFGFLIKIASYIDKLSLSKQLRYAKYVLTFGGVFFMFFFSFNTYAQTSSSTESQFLDTTATWDAEVKKCKVLTASDGLNIECATRNTLVSALTTVINETAPEMTVSGQKMLADESIPNSAKTGLLSMVDNAIGASFSAQPNIDVVAYMQSEWVPGYTDNTSVYAGNGYDFLKGHGITGLYRTFQTISYILFVIILIISGFMIMFRQKIGGQTAITIMNTLPNVILGLVLVTFSFSIVGILLNVGSWLTDLIAGFLGFASPQEGIMLNSPLGLFSFFGQTIDAEKSGLFLDVPAISGGGGILLLVLGSIFSSGILATAGIIMLLLAVVIICLMIYAGIRVFITLFKAYLSILIQTVTAPIQITIGTFPGNNKFIMNWFNSVLKSVLTFPIVYLIINLPIYLFSNEINLDIQGLTSGTLEIEGGGLSSVLGFILYAVFPIVCFFFAADAPKILNDFLPTESGKGLQEAIAGTQAGLSKIPLVGSLISGK
ncbi:MAG TPA: hypothetical protein PKJ86_01035 [Candidatus Dojkabacteria bacterium]|nr:hypothetical protein [Candidatus Dojkabacteria bacterium]